MPTQDDFKLVLEKLEQSDLSPTVLYELSNLHGQELDLFAETWPSFSVERRQTIASRLVEIAEADFEVDFTEIFKVCLRDSNAKVRAVGIEGLWEVEDIALVRPLIDLLSNDTSPMVREAAATSLSRFALMAELGRLRTRLSDRVWGALWATFQNSQEDLHVRRRAAESLAYFGRSEVKQVIERAYQDEEPKMRISAVFAMGRSADEEWADTILAELDRDDPEMRYEATRACGALRILEATPSLTKMVADPDPETRLMAIWALGQIGSSEARRVLEICTEMGDEAIQDAAEEALDELEFMHSTLDLSMYDFGPDDADEDIESGEDEEKVE
jgi:HEAT repeat protein